jgi:soluble lytic murein transglycosylase-like protein
MSLSKLKSVFVFFIVLSAVFGLFALKSVLNEPITLNQQQENLAQEIAKTYQIDIADAKMYVQEAYFAAGTKQIEPTLILAVISVESGFQAIAKSKVGATGLMQVMPKVHKEKFEAFGGTDYAQHPIINMRVGTSILAEYIKRYGSVPKALQAYNGDKNGTKYSKKVLAVKNHLDRFVLV